MRNQLLFFLCTVLVSACNVPQTSESSNEPTQLLHFEGQTERPQIVLVSGDEEYRSEEALPQLAKMLSRLHGFNCTVLFAQDPAKPGIIDPNYVRNIPGLDALEEADLMVIFTRFRALPDEQMAYIDRYLKRGKPVLGIRTATHAFMFQDTSYASSYRHYGNYYEGDRKWEGGFGRLVLGEKWISHHGEHKHQSTFGLIAAGANDHPVTNGISDRDIWGPTDVYGVRLPLPGDAQPIVLGQVTNRAGVEDQQDLLYGMRNTDMELPALTLKKNKSGQEEPFNPNDPMMPIAWTKTYELQEGKAGMAFTSTIGSSTDLLEVGTRRLLINAAFWLLGETVPVKADVSLIGDYKPTPYEFREDSYWDQKALTVSELKY